MMRRLVGFFAALFLAGLCGTGAFAVELVTWDRPGDAAEAWGYAGAGAVSYTHLRAHET